MCPIFADEDVQYMYALYSSHCMMIYLTVPPPKEPQACVTYTSRDRKRTVLEPHLPTALYYG